MKPQTYVMAIDIEMSGASLRNPEDAKTRKSGLPLKAEGDIIGIGAHVLCIKEKEGDGFVAEDQGSLFLSMYRPYNKYHAHGTLLSASDENEPRIGLYTCSVGLPKEEIFLWNEHTRGCTGLWVSRDNYKPIDDWELNNHTVFERRCWDQFWSKHPEMLKVLEYKGPFNKKEMEYHAMLRLNDFRAKWQEIAEKEGCRLVVVADNVSFDIGMIDQLMKRWLPKKRPSVYKVSRGSDTADARYNGGTPCTHSMQKGLLAAVDPLWLFSDAKDSESEWIEWLLAEGELTEEEKPKFWSLTARIRYLYGIPKPPVEHDHNPANDAFTIAHEYAAIQLIGLDDYKLSEARVMHKRPASTLGDEERKKAKKGKE